MQKLLLIPLLLLSACSSLEKPTYSPPDETAAKSAYIAGQLAQADMLEGRPVAQVSKFPQEAIRKVIDTKTLITEFQIEGSIVALRKNAGIDRVSVSDCEWQEIDPEKVDKIARPMIGENPPGAYFCQAVVYVTQNYGIKARAAMEGFFFKGTNNNWMFIGKDAHGFLLPFFIQLI
ncbi:hypothetical protein [Chamaesiphon sp. OTE_20_metabat_361]|uniref:hypothetical protein n=1 Tax=Chamaesiphon sp. OTE_20_metabat_361 TaxID=2964689 RepID=UPI00286BC63B|nr:hypothetical protein [Chamaesiphon sp. OTE_20_metabat_361]